MSRNLTLSHRVLPSPEPEADSVADSSKAGRRYRFERLSLPLVLGDLRFGKDDPGPGDCVPAFDLPTVDGGRFRSGDSRRPPPRS